MDRIVTTASLNDAEKCTAFVVFDTETTGLYPWRDKVIEIGAVRFCGGEPVETFHSMIDPGMHIPEMVSQINHITDDMVAGAPTASEVMAAFDDFVGTDDLVGHNIDFDLRFVKSAGSTLPDGSRKYFDTAELARQMVKGPDKVYDRDTGKWRTDYTSQYEVKGHSLGTMCDFYGIGHGELHRADVDALATGRLFTALMKDTDRLNRARRNSRMAKDFEFEIIEHIGVLADKTRGWKREVNLISWSGAEPKIDIRDWSPDHSKMGKGISLTREELDKLKELI
ncbi:MAG: hypothetical protein IKE85_02995 [Mogibacterium sp.]|nr:hypothetical protein [Mogibacterium sp.]